MQQPPDARLTPRSRRVCASGRQAPRCSTDRSRSLGSQYVLALRARNCSTGDILADEQAQVARKEDVLGSLSQMATRVRTRLGESVATIEKYSRPLQEATTASLDALKAFTTARQVYGSSGRARAQPLFERAIAIDPDFAIAHAQLGIFYSNVGESALSRQSRSRRTSCAIAPATPSDSSSRRCTTGRSPATWTGRWRHWTRGRRAIRAITRRTDCWLASQRGAPADTRSRSPRPTRSMALDPEGSSPLQPQQGVHRTPPESPGRGRGHHPSSGQSSSLPLSIS